MIRYYNSRFVSSVSEHWDQWQMHSCREHVWKILWSTRFHFVCMRVCFSFQYPPWEVDSHSAKQEITHLLWNPKVHYHVHKSMPLVPLLSQMHPVHTFPSYFPKIHSVIFLPSTPRFFKWSLPFRFPDQNFVCIFLSPIHVTCLIHQLDHTNNTLWSIHVMKFLIMQSSPVPHDFLPLRSKYSPWHPVLIHPQSVLFP